jgi:hypothetical protein
VYRIAQLRALLDAFFHLPAAQRSAALRAADKSQRQNPNGIA